MKAVRGPAPKAVYAIPRLVGSIQDCHIHNTMELPGCGFIETCAMQSTTFTRARILPGRRVLEIGLASGYLTFEMERRGADVVSID